MKNGIIVLLVITVLLSVAGAVTPVTTIGSNPWFSTERYPQDLLLREGNYLFYNPQYRNLPFWGDIDEPANKPNTNVDYTITGAEFSRDGGSFKHSGAVHSLMNNVGYVYRLNDKIMANVEINSDFDALRNSAEGEFTGDTYPDGKTIPFSYKMGHTLGTFSGRAMVASKFRDLPFGVMVEGGMKNSLMLTKNLSFKKYRKLTDSIYDLDSLVEYEMSGDEARAFWGWAIPGCNHIFGERGTQGDSWFQNQYAVGPMYNFTLASGVTTSLIKAGGAFRMMYGHQDQYSWQPRQGVLYGNDSVLTGRYIGSYEKESLARMTWLGEGQLFGNLTVRSAKQFSLNVFSSLRYADSSVGSALSENLDAVNGTKDRKRSVAIECFPNLSVKLGEFLNYVDLAGIFAYKFSRYSNTREIWLGGGMVTTFQNGSPRENWGDVWENFSYANENVFDVGADISAMFPVYTQGAHTLLLNLHMVGDVRFTYQNKYYGQSNPVGSRVNFAVENIRKNYAREVMFNTEIMLHYVLGPMQLRFQFSKPVLYAILPKTEVTDAHGKRTAGYPLEKSPQLISKQGLTLGFYGAYDVVLPFLNR